MHKTDDDIDCNKENPKHIRAMKDGKAPLELLTTSADDGDARVLQGGATKYGIRNYLIDEIRATTYLGAIRRHLNDWAEGRDVDLDSGENPLNHIRACCGIVIDATKHATLIDDRGHAESIDRGDAQGSTEPVVTVTYTYTAFGDAETDVRRTRVYGPFASKSAAVEFVRQTQRQMPGVASFNTVLPIPSPENKNARIRNEEIDGGHNDFDGSHAHGEAAGSAEGTGDFRGSVGPSLERDFERLTDVRSVNLGSFDGVRRTGYNESKQ